jgi:hypothetical protein
MYGLVNAAVQELVQSRFGDAKWEEIKKRAGVDIDLFSRMEQYPDALTYRLVAAASQVLGIPPDDVMIAFGEFWVLYTGKEGYGHLFDLAGNSLREFLFNLDNLHTRVGQNFAHLRPPSFRFDVVSDDVLRMHYLSERHGLCPMVIGLLNGLAKRFHAEVAIDHPVCSRRGAAHCEFILRIPRAAEPPTSSTA